MDGYSRLCIQELKLNVPKRSADTRGYFMETRNAFYDSVVAFGKGDCRRKYAPQIENPPAIKSNSRPHSYYDDAEKWTIIFWSEDHPFYPLFKRLDLTAVLDWLAVMAAIPRSLPSVLDNLLSWMFTTIALSSP
jgi:hypothetical protein